VLSTRQGYEPDWKVASADTAAEVFRGLEVALECHWRLGGMSVRFGRAFGLSHHWYFAMLRVNGLRYNWSKVSGWQ
jgi:hypothetical protein